MARRIDLYIKVKGILEFEAGKKTKSQIAREVGALCVQTSCAILDTREGFTAFTGSIIQHCSIRTYDLKPYDGTGDDPSLQESPAMPEAKTA